MLLGRNAELGGSEVTGIAAPVVSSRATSRLYSRVTTTRHESVHDRATAQRTAVQLKSGGRRLLRKVISSKIGAGAQRIDESGAPSARIPGRGFEVAPTLGPPIKGTAAEDAQSCTSARTIRLDTDAECPFAFSQADHDVLPAHFLHSAP